MPSSFWLPRSVRLCCELPDCELPDCEPCMPEPLEAPEPPEPPERPELPELALRSGLEPLEPRSLFVLPDEPVESRLLRSSFRSAIVRVLQV